jgi:hypothetical protein
VLKGNRPLELRWHPRRKAVLYASDPAYLDAVLAEEKGWREIPVPPMSLVVFRREDLAGYLMEPFEFVAQERKGPCEVLPLLGPPSLFPEDDAREPAHQGFPSLWIDDEPAEDALGVLLRVLLDPACGIGISEFSGQPGDDRPVEHVGQPREPDRIDALPDQG